MALRGCRIRILVEDSKRQLGQAAEDLGATLLDGASLDEAAHVVIAMSVAGPDFLVRLSLMHASPTNAISRAPDRHYDDIVPSQSATRGTPEIVTPAWLLNCKAQNRKVKPAPLDPQQLPCTHMRIHPSGGLSAHLSEANPIVIVNPIVGISPPAGPTGSLPPASLVWTRDLHHGIPPRLVLPRGVAQCHHVPGRGALQGHGVHHWGCPTGGKDPLIDASYRLCMNAPFYSGPPDAGVGKVIVARPLPTLSRLLPAGVCPLQVKGKCTHLIASNASGAKYM